MGGHDTSRGQNQAMSGSDTISSDLTREPDAPRAGGGRHLPILVPLDPAEGGEWFLITRKESVIGRGREADFVVRDEAISRFHALLIYENAGDTAAQPRCLIKDCGSRNGTYLNGRRIEEMKPLASGDQVFLGNTTLVYYLRSEAEVNADRRLRYLATTDALTGLLNRGSLATEFLRELDRARRYGRLLSLLLLDIDNFKTVNDTHGHLAGDEVLRQIAALIATQVRTHDVIGRYGGEEFAVLLPETGEQGATAIAERLRKTIAEHEFAWENVRLDLTVSIGMAGVNPDNADTSIEEFIGRADAALLRAKSSGKNRVVLAEPRP